MFAAVLFTKCVGGVGVGVEKFLCSAQRLEKKSLAPLQS